MHPRISPATTKQALTCSSPAHTLNGDGTLKSTRWHVYNGGCPKGQTRGCPCLDLSFGRQHPNPKIIQSRAFHRFIRSSPTRLLPNPTLILEKTQTRTDWLPPLRSCHSQNWSDPTICQMPELALITTKQRSDLFHIYMKNTFLVLTPRSYLIMFGPTRPCGHWVRPAVWDFPQYPYFRPGPAVNFKSFSKTCRTLVMEVSLHHIIILLWEVKRLKSHQNLIWDRARVRGLIR